MVMQTFNSDIRQLFTKLSEEEFQQLDDLFSKYTAPKKQPTFSKNKILHVVLEKTSAFYSYPVDSVSVKFRTRKREVVAQRQICMYFMKKLTDISLLNIGRFFGRYDHTTVIHSCQTVRDLYDTDPDYRALINSISLEFNQLEK